MSILFDSIIFGPVNSRRLGSSLGINLLPTRIKYCTFNCVYCECGWSFKETFKDINLPDRQTIKNSLKSRLLELNDQGKPPEAITFAGNGEPTLHPEFPVIIDDTIKLRDEYAPNSMVTVLSNATMLHKQKVVDALVKTDKAIMKLDAGTEEMFSNINDPSSNHLSLDIITNQLEAYGGWLIIQTLFLRGSHNEKIIDNTSPGELDAWMNRILKINPKSVMIYSIDRETPEENLEKVSLEELEEIAERLRKRNVRVEVY
jgi:wyosine [tRNA(Phe)-imidazoG37] synthetase (radical SAM superfamily)